MQLLIRPERYKNITVNHFIYQSWMTFTQNLNLFEVVFIVCKPYLIIPAHTCDPLQHCQC